MLSLFNKKHISAVLIIGTILIILFSRMEYQIRLNNRVQQIKKNYLYLNDYWSNMDTVLMITASLLEEAGLDDRDRKFFLNNFFTLRKSSLLTGMGICYYPGAGESPENRENLYIATPRQKKYPMEQGEFRDIIQPGTLYPAGLTRRVVIFSHGEASYLRIIKPFITNGKAEGAVFMDISLGELEKAIRKSTPSYVESLTLTDNRDRVLLRYSEDGLHWTDAPSLPPSLPPSRWNGLVQPIPLSSSEKGYELTVTANKRIALFRMKYSVYMILFFYPLVLFLSLFSGLLRRYRVKDSNNWALNIENRRLRKEISLRRKAEEQLEFHAYHDMVTGMKNLRAFKEETLPPAGEKDNRHLIQFTLSNIRELSALLDRNYIDGILQEFTVTLEHHAPFQPRLFRGNGFSFYLIHNDINPGEAEQLARRYCGELQNPLSYRGREIPLHVQISLAPFRGASSLEDVLKRTQLSQVHKKRFDKVISYSRKMENLISRKLFLDTSMGKRDFLDELFFLYQPIVHMDDRSVAGYECLVRWHNRERDEIISPAEFIPLAEENGKIIDLGWRALEENLKLLCREAIPRDCFVSVNVSPIQFIESDFIEKINGLMKTYGIGRSRIKLEITESHVYRSDGFFWQTVEKLTAEGYYLAMDDFGTGESSINRLKEIRFDTIKIDQSFVRDISLNGKNRELFSSLLSLGSSLDNRVVVEGIETEEEHRILADLGVRYGQGYLYSRPVPLEDLLLLPIP